MENESNAPVIVPFEQGPQSHLPGGMQNPTALGILAEIRGSAATNALMAGFPGVRGKIGAAAAQQQGDGIAFLAESQEIGVLRDSGLTERETYAAHHKKLQDIKQNYGESPAAKKATDEATAAFEKERQRLDSMREDFAKRIISRQPAPPARLALSPEIVPELTALEIGYKLQPPEDSMAFAFSELERANDPSLPPVEQYKSNQRLEYFWLPAMSRRASAPEKFALRLAPAAGQLAEMIRDHLANVKGEHRHRAVSNVVSALTSQLKSIRHLTAQNGGRPLDNTVLAAAAPLIFGKK